MKNSLRITLALALVGSLAFGATQFTRILNLKVLGKALIGSNTETDAITKSLSASATVDFASSYGGSELSSAITVTGAVAGDACEVGVPAAAGILKANFECSVTAADTVKIRFSPNSTQRGQATLVSGTPSTVVVGSIVAGSLCTATPVGLTAAIAAGGLATSLTTTNLTITGPDSVTTDVIYECAAAVDPASGTYYVRVTSAQ